MADSKRQRYLKRLKQLDSERSSWIAHWRDLSDYVKPRSFRYLQGDRNKGTKQSQNIINNTATRALRTMSAGMMAGITSPARPWFRLGTRDPGLSAFGPVRAWLDIAEAKLRLAFAGSNIYKCLHSVYDGLGLHGTAAMLVEEDATDILRGYVFPIGQYMLFNSDRLQVDGCFREYSMTVAQVVAKFGEDKCTTSTREKYKSGQLDAWVKVLHIIEPNDAYSPGKMGPKGKKWLSCWMECSGDDKDGFLRESGFEEFPLMAPRWGTVGEDVYGESPAMAALGDIRALQALERTKGALVQKIADPPMRGPSSLMNQETSLMPGGMTYVDALGPGQTFAPVFEINPASLAAIEESCRQHEARIVSALYADLWMLITDGQEDPRKTATEVAALKEEKMLQLGPVMENLERELLGPLIDRAFAICLRSGLLPPPPKELHGQKLSVEYISIMAQAQKMLGLASKDRLLSFVETIAQVKPDITDKLDLDAMVEGYAEDLGVPSTIMRPQEEVDALRNQRAQAQAQQAQVEQAAQGAQAAKSLSETDTSGDNALTKLLGGVAAAQQNGGGLVQ